VRLNGLEPRIKRGIGIPLVFFWRIEAARRGMKEIRVEACVPAAKPD